MSREYQKSEQTVMVRTLARGEKKASGVQTILGEWYGPEMTENSFDVEESG